jgi:hypothetical protein
VLGDRVRFGCGARSRDLRLHNANPDEVRLSVRVVAEDGRGTGGDDTDGTGEGSTETDTDPALVVTDDLDAGAVRRLSDAVPSAGTYRLTATTAAGASASYRWRVCPPRGPVTVRVWADGSVSVERGRTD